MGTADPPDLPLSPLKEGTSTGETQGSEQVKKSVWGSTEAIDKDMQYGKSEKVGSKDLSSKSGRVSTEVNSEGLDEVTDKVGLEDPSLEVEATKKNQIPTAKGSWVRAVQGQKVLKKYEVEIEMKDGIGSIVVPEEITKDVAPLWDDFLIGKFLDSAPHIAKVHSIVNKIWTLNDRAQKIEVYEVNETMMKFRILNQADKNRILRRGMWNLAGVPVVMTKWSPVIEKEKPPTQSIPMWVHVKRVPLKMFSWQGLSFMTSPIGVPKRLHPDTAQCLNLDVAKVFVNVDLTKDLPKQLNFNVQGEEVLVEYIYPWLPKRCEKCGKWGHNEKVCSDKKEGLKGKQVEMKEGEIIEEVYEKETVGCEEKEKSQENKKTATPEMGEQGRELVSVIPTGEKTPMKNKDDGWADVSPGKASRSPRELEFGQVSILTKSRFSVLTPADEEVWKATVGKLMREEGSYGWERVLQAIVNGLREKIQTMLLRYSFQAVIYALWLERNARRVGETEQPAACMIARLEKLVRNRVTSLRKKNGAKYDKAMVTWFERK
ncbi:hypothetical protein Bca101_064637 [Brassica carinata]